MKNVFLCVLIAVFMPMMVSCGDDEPVVPKLNAKITINGTPFVIYGATVDIRRHSNCVHVDFDFDESHNSGPAHSPDNWLYLELPLNCLDKAQTINISDQSTELLGFVSTRYPFNMGELRTGVCSGTLLLNIIPSTKDVYFDFNVKFVSTLYHDEQETQPLQFFDVVGVISGKAAFYNITG